jgi:N-acyl-D-amino-acid deacylase
LVDPRAESKVRQGVTTEVIGNCGSSPAPLPGGPVEETRDWAAPLGLDITWASMAEYLERLRRPGIALNVVPLVGHNPVRGSVMGDADLPPTHEQQARMEGLVAEAMEQGARGFTTGFFFPPGRYARTEELVGLARIAARHGGIYASHIRGYDHRLLGAVREAIEIGERAGIQVEISHVKVSGYRNWPDAERLLATLDAARSRGVRVGCDQYPYAGRPAPLASILPDWARAGGAQPAAQRLSDPQVRRRLKEEDDWAGRTGVQDWDDLLVIRCDARPETVGRTLAEVAAAERKDPLSVAFDLIAISAGQVTVLLRDESEENLRSLMRHPGVVVGSDASALAPHGVLGGYQRNPRAYGTFPRVLGRYVREAGVLSLPAAVQKMTSVTAERFGLAGRGVVRAGAWADLVLFDAGRVIDRATFADPHRFPAGIHYVLVNGQVVVARGRHTGALPGQVL